MKKSNRLMLLGSVVGLVLTAAAPLYADMGQGPKADVNKDGTIDRAEFDAERAARFKVLDANGDGFITAEEMKAFHDQRRAKKADGKDGSPNMGARLLKSADTSGDGKVTANEWQAESLKKFVKLDADGDGAVTAEELQEMRKSHDGKLGDANKGPRGDGMARLDTDKDGKVSLTEWNALGDKMFARMDENKDGKIAEDEMPKHRKHNKMPDGETPILP